MIQKGAKLDAVRVLAFVQEEEEDEELHQKLP